MIARIILLVLLFYFLTLLQVSFLVHFSVFGLFFNIVLLALVLLNLFLISSDSWSLFSGFLAGLFLDIFSFDSFYFFGFFILISLVISFLIQTVFKRYVRIPFAKRA